jgi:hypothetical protein
MTGRKVEVMEQDLVDLGNNESATARGIFRQPDGTYLALTFTRSREFRTLAGARKWLDRTGR